MYRVLNYDLCGFCFLWSSLLMPAQASDYKYNYVLVTNEFLVSSHYLLIFVKSLCEYFEI